MLTDKQKEALNAVLGLHKENKMTDEQVLTVIEALTENTPTIQYVPPITDKSQQFPWITYKTEPVTCKQVV